MPCFDDTVGKVFARGIFVKGARVGHGQHSNIQWDKRFLRFVGHEVFLVSLLQ
jgi:hypothetical protein